MGIDREESVKLLSFFVRDPNVIDVTDVREGSVKRRLKAPKFLLYASLIALLAIGGGFLLYSGVVLPNQYRSTVEQALSLRNNEKSGNLLIESFRDLTEQERFRKIGKYFSGATTTLPNSIRVDAARSAFLLAIHLGSVRARLDYGEALEDGKLGFPSPEAANAEYAKVLYEVRAKAQKGDPTASYTYALMLRFGLGVERDMAAAENLVKSVWKELPDDDLEDIATTFLLRDKDFKLEVIDALISKGRFNEGLQAELKSECQSLMAGELEVAAVFIKVDFDQYEYLARKAFKNQRECELGRMQKTAANGNPSAERRMNELNEVVEKGADVKYGKHGRSIPLDPVVDSEAQSVTGYLNGTKQLAKNGLSSFKVDNSKGDDDAIVRLYRDGRKPAVRSMYVKNGESFTAESIAAGSYKMRYRFVGNDDTFEANETFQMSETRESDGIKFSRINVTLFKVLNGNMSVKKVDATDF
jgi:hypothetical protein